MLYLFYIAYSLYGKQMKDYIIGFIWWIIYLKKNNLNFNQFRDFSDSFFSLTTSKISHLSRFSDLFLSNI